jgi:MOSC domain-containing protein YiiM
MSATVIAVAASAAHTMTKPTQDRIRLLAGLGVAGDAHMGEMVRHRSRVAIDPGAPNLRQVHLIHMELLDALRDAGFILAPGQMGENITTRGIDLLGLPTGTRLHIGEMAVVEITGLRNPCGQLDAIQPGLMAAVIERGPDGKLIRKAGVMSIVITSGDVRPGDAIRAVLPPPPRLPLERV